MAWSSPCATAPGTRSTSVVIRSKAVPNTQAPKDDTTWDASSRVGLIRLIPCGPDDAINGGS